MATINGPDQSDFGSMTEVDCFVGAPMRLGIHVKETVRYDFEGTGNIKQVTSCLEGPLLGGS